MERLVANTVALASRPNAPSTHKERRNTMAKKQAPKYPNVLYVVYEEERSGESYLTCQADRGGLAEIDSTRQVAVYELKHMVTLRNTTVIE